MAKRNCWEFKKCGRQPGGERVKELGECPAVAAFKVHGINDGINGGRACWAVAGTFCGGQIQGEFSLKFKSCSQCDFFNLVAREEGKRLITVQDILSRLNQAG